ncbi:MAG: tRNA pseudouridine(38-40) synthase TruA [Planctomycetales bacterium]|nr:tRNA pseudouridine(38-40) synthase TruA [Planctomycetales bacterium]
MSFRAEPASFVVHRIGVTVSMASTVRTIKLTLAYDGTDYSGWQYQPDRTTVQGVLEDAIRSVTQFETRVTASGRTDAGVHAIGQVAGFKVATRLDDRVLCRALNSSLPFDIRILDLATVRDSFHPIRDATSKRYRYVLQAGGLPDVFTRRYCWFTPKPLDFDAMEAAAKRLVGKMDFASMQTTGAPRVSTVRTVREISMQRQRQSLSDQIVFEVEADGFLYNMVRNIVGTLTVVGQGRALPEWIDEVIAARCRTAAGPTAPAQGLFLLNVSYNQTDDKSENETV